MIYRDFGKTGLKVSAISVGCEYVWTTDKSNIYRARETFDFCLEFTRRNYGNE